MALVEVRDLVKNYQALRPLRIQQFAMGEGQIVALLGLDAPAAEVLVGLLTGALLPDAGEIRLFDRSTAAVSDSEAWLAMLDGVGIITERAVLIGQLTVEQNVAMPFTLDVDPLDAEVKPKVEALAREVGLDASVWQIPAGTMDAEGQARVRIARALALSPRLLLAEHPSATLPRDAVERIAHDLARIARTRHLAVLTLTADEAFARALGGKLLIHDAASGKLKPPSRWRKLFQ